MDEVVVRRLCDLCFTKDESRVESAQRFEVIIKQPGATRLFPRTVDVCPQHADQLRELWSVITSAGVTVQPVKEKKTGEIVKAESTADGRYKTCPVCGKQVRPMSYYQHLMLAHHAKVRQPKKCPDCGATPVNERGMVFHRNTHGYDYEAELLASVRRKG